MATSSFAAMKSSLVVLMLLSVVVASQAHQVSFKNTFKKAMAFNGVWTGVGVTTVLEVNGMVMVEMFDGKGVKLVGKFKCPEDVKALEFELKGGFVKAQITDFSGLGSTLVSGRRSLRDGARPVRALTSAVAAAAAAVSSTSSRASSAVAAAAAAASSTSSRASSATATAVAAAAAAAASTSSRAAARVVKPIGALVLSRYGDCLCAGLSLE